MMAARASDNLVDLPLAKAIAYASLGWHVLPIRPNDKRPLIDEWQKRASRDPAIIRDWWQRWPRAGIGVHCGLSGLAVIDVDPRNGGAESLEALELDKGPVWEQEPCEAHTGGGGRHYVFTAPDALQLPAKLAPGVDLLSGDRYFIVEPSVHPLTGRPYRWTRGANPLNKKTLPSLPNEWHSGARRAIEATVDADPLATLTPQPLADTRENRLRVRRALFSLSADVDYHDWMRVVFAVLATGLPDAVDLARDWSETAPDRFDADAFDRLVHSYRDERRHGGDLIGAGTLFHLAKAAGWREGATAGGSDPQHFKLIPAHEFAHAAPVSWLVRSLVQREGLGVVYGDAGSGKTFFILDLSGSVALGVPWRDYPVERGTVVYIAAEGAGGFRKRLQALAAGHNVQLEGVDLFVIANAPNFLVDDDEAIATAIEAVGPAALIVVDTLAAVTPGGNENSGEDMGAVIARCKRLQARTGAFVILVHHSGKDGSRGARGWSGLRAAVDLEIEVTRNGEQRVAHVTKQKDGEDGNAFPFRLKVVDLGLDGEGESITSCTVEHVAELPEGGPKHARPTGKNQRIVFDVVEQFGPCGIDEVLTRSVERMVADPEKADKRRDRARESLEGLMAGKFVIHQNEVIRIFGTPGPEWIEGGGL